MRAPPAGKGAGLRAACTPGVASGVRGPGARGWRGARDPPGSCTWRDCFSAGGRGAPGPRPSSQGGSAKLTGSCPAGPHLRFTWVRSSSRAPPASRNAGRAAGPGAQRRDQELPLGPRPPPGAVPAPGAGRARPRLAHPPRGPGAADRGLPSRPPAPAPAPAPALTSARPPGPSPGAGPPARPASQGRSGARGARGGGGVPASRPSGRAEGAGAAVSPPPLPTPARRPGTRGGRGARGGAIPGAPSPDLPAAAGAAAALRKPCPVAGHHGNGTAEFRGRRAARPDPRPASARPPAGRCGGLGTPHPPRLRQGPGKVWAPLVNYLLV